MSRTIDEAAARIEETSASLRTFAHLDEADLQRVKVGRELEVVLGLIPPEVRRDTQTRVDVDIDLVVACDARALNQAFMTIVRNAYEATNGSGMVTARAQRQAEWARIEIIDTGCGMSEDLRARLFEVSPKRRGERVAAGFGLPAAQSIVYRHGGTIHEQSVLG